MSDMVKESITALCEEPIKEQESVQTFQVEIEFGIEPGNPPWSSEDVQAFLTEAAEGYLVKVTQVEELTELFTMAEQITKGLI